MNERTEEQTAPDSAPVPLATPHEQKNTLMGILCYVGPFVLIPYLVVKDDAFIAFHAKQGTVLLAIEVGAWVAGLILWPLALLVMLAQLGAIVLSLIGIVHVLQHRERELPLVGQFSKYVPAR